MIEVIWRQPGEYLSGRRHAQALGRVDDAISSRRPSQLRTAALAAMMPPRIEQRASHYRPAKRDISMAYGHAMPRYGDLLAS